ncbi:nuclease-like protein [Novosphingobium sp. PhB165]|uniref:thermonuclease family protein n=1 Tax=Novosphingobium sp. PhB165 TaxID=2485105 RepID=UPI00104F7C72|nr:thermonuclease family protein [Novosphingobium sp. PhB165]TCM12865.1 nuclease-like protein [Novosphingobium sp. PhB165]
MSLIFAAAVSACIANVHDGDTVRLCDGERVRIQNIDAPEVAGSPRCSPQSMRRLIGSKNPSWCDYQLGDRSRDALASLLGQGPVTIARTGTDRYGRTLARLVVNGKDAGSYLVAMGLARPWQ